jgi:hypothetical protein
MTGSMRWRVFDLIKPPYRQLRRVPSLMHLS